MILCHNKYASIKGTVRWFFFFQHMNRTATLCNSGTLGTSIGISDFSKNVYFYQEIKIIFLN